MPGMRVVAMGVVAMGVVVMARHGCGNHSERPNLDRDSYVKKVREKIFRPCDLMIKNITY